MTRTVVLCVALLVPALSHGWFDETHMAIARAAGSQRWHHAAGPDMVKLKWRAETLNHRCYNSAGSPVTEAAVRAQIARYDDPEDAEGHLYGAIVGAVRAYRTSRDADEYGQYHLDFLAHYIGDLSNPFHNTPRDAFSQRHHKPSEDVIERTAAQGEGRIRAAMGPVTIGASSLEDDLAREIARLGEASRRLAVRLRSENRAMTEDEAYAQAAASASLLKAVLAVLPVP